MGRDGQTDARRLTNGKVGSTEPAAETAELRLRGLRKHNSSEIGRLQLGLPMLRGMRRRADFHYRHSGVNICLVDVCAGEERDSHGRLPILTGFILSVIRIIPVIRRLTVAPFASLTVAARPYRKASFPVFGLPPGLCRIVVLDLITT